MADPTRSSGSLTPSEVTDTVSQPGNARSEIGSAVNDSKSLLEVYKAGDHVYLEPNDASEPYRIGRIIEIISPKLTARCIANVCLFWRACDVPMHLLEIDENTENSQRLLVGTMQRQKIKISRLQGRCTVKHESEIADLNEYNNTPDCFYFTKVYNYWTKGMFEVFPVERCSGIPPEIAKILDPFDYVVSEIAPPHFCAACLFFISNINPITCSRCSLVYHEACLQPPTRPEHRIRDFTVRACSKCFTPNESKTSKKITWPFIYYGEQTDYLLITGPLAPFRSETYLPSNRLGPSYSAEIPPLSTPPCSPGSDDIITSPPPLSPIWSEAEINIFERSIDKLSGNLSSISKLLIDKSTKNVVAFYYKWLAKKRPSTIPSLSKYKPKPSFSSFCESASLSSQKLSGNHLIINVPKHMLKSKIECSNCASKHASSYRILPSASSKTIFCIACALYFLKYASLPKVTRPVLQKNKHSLHLQDKRRPAFPLTQSKCKKSLKMPQKRLSSPLSSDEYFSDPDPIFTGKLSSHCAVCFNRKGPLATCSLCSMVVHPVCFGIPECSSFTCQRCLNETHHTSLRSYNCILCPKSLTRVPDHLNAVKQTRWNNWAHVFCALWSHSAAFANPDSLDPIYICPPISSSVCDICHDSSGICSKCPYKNCTTNFHVACARDKLFSFVISTDSSLPSLAIYCKLHSLPDYAQAVNTPLDDQRIKIFINSKKLIPPYIDSPVKQFAFAYSSSSFPPTTIPHHEKSSAQKNSLATKKIDLPTIPFKMAGVLNPPLPKIIANGK